MTIDRHDIEKFSDEIETRTIFYQLGYQKDDEGNEVNVLSLDDNRQSCAKEIINDTKGTVRHYIRWGNGSFVNPFHTDFFRIRLRDYRWLKVSNEVFNMYVRFLRTGSNKYLHLAERAQ